MKSRRPQAAQTARCGGGVASGGAGLQRRPVINSFVAYEAISNATKTPTNEHGVGAVLAFTLIALLPELGKMSRKQCEPWPLDRPATAPFWRPASPCCRPDGHRLLLAISPDLQNIYGGTVPKRNLPEPRAGRPVHGQQGAQSCPRRHEVCQDLASSTWGVNNPLIKLTLTVADVQIRPDRIRRM